MRAYALTMYHSGMVGEVGYSFGACDSRGHPFARSGRAFVACICRYHRLWLIVVKGDDARLLQG